MKTLDILRQGTTRLINENPVQITVHRATWTSDGAGGRLKIESDLASITARLIASQRTTRALESTQRESGLMTVAAYALIAPHDANLQHGSDVEDQFELGGKVFRVLRVIPRKWRGDTYSVHAVLEEVS